MTCIVGIEHNAGVTLGADSYVSGSAIMTLHASSSKLIIGKRHAFALTGLMRVGDILRHEIKIAEHVDDKDKYVAIDLMGQLRELLTRHCPEAAQSPKDDDSWSLLFAFGGAIYYIDHGYNPSRCAEGYIALGSGGSVAMGALHATKNDKNHRRRATRALEAAVAHAGGVRLPLVIHTVNG